MSEKTDDHIDYRGYGLDAIQYGPGWRVLISPGPRYKRTDPNHATGNTKEEAFARARAIVDNHVWR